MPDAARHVVIHGRVQGVWFRGWMRQQADRLGIRGWVRNRRDGTVEAVVQGDAADIDAMIQKCWSGPPLARVTDVVVTTTETPEGEGFQARPTL